MPFQPDLVIGAVLLPGASAPKLISHDLIKKMKTGSVVVDVAIDQGGVLGNLQSDDTSRPNFCG